MKHLLLCMIVFFLIYDTKERSKTLNENGRKVYKSINRTFVISLRGIIIVAECMHVF